MLKYIQFQSRHIHKLRLPALLGSHIEICVWFCRSYAALEAISTRWSHCWRYSYRYHESSISGMCIKSWHILKQNISYCHSVISEYLLFLTLDLLRVEPRTLVWRIHPQSGLGGNCCSLRHQKSDNTRTVSEALFDNSKM